MDRVVPAAEDRQVARSVRVRQRSRVRAAVPPVFGLDVAVRRLAYGIELYPSVTRESSSQPDPVVVGALTAEMAIFDMPNAGPRRDPVRSRIASERRIGARGRGSYEIVLEGRAQQVGCGDCILQGNEGSRGRGRADACTRRSCIASRR